MDSRQLVELIESHGAALQLYAAGWCDCPEDCVQIAFTKIATESPMPENPVGWLFRVTRNEAITQQRASARRRKRERRFAENRQSSERTLFQRNIEHEIDSEKLSAALNELVDIDREIMVAKIWGGLTFDQIAELVDCSSSAAHRRYHSAVNQLREKLELKWLVKTKTKTS